MLICTGRTFQLAFVFPTNVPYNDVCLCEFQWTLFILMYFLTCVRIDLEVVDIILQPTVLLRSNICQWQSNAKTPHSKLMIFDFRAIIKSFVLQYIET